MKDFTQKRVFSFDVRKDNLDIDNVFCSLEELGIWNIKIMLLILILSAIGSAILVETGEQYLKIIEITK